jgi:hypothetical protein
MQQEQVPRKSGGPIGHHHHHPGAGEVTPSLVKIEIHMKIQMQDLQNQDLDHGLLLSSLKKMELSDGVSCPKVVWSWLSQAVCLKGLLRYLFCREK